MSDLRFKFHWIDANGQPTSVFAKKGAVGEQALVLENTEIPIAALVDVEARGEYVALSAMTGEAQAQSMVVKTSQASRLTAELGRLRSAVWAETHRQELQQQGLGHTFRRQTCPDCAATIDLTDMPVTPQISCDFCHTISTLPSATQQEGVTPGPDRGYRLCDECGMYSKPRQFTIFYFYFLLVVYGWNSRTTWRCPACMRGEAWKMLLGNLPFVLGVPVAGAQLFRAYGGTDVGGHYPGLDRANLRARRGDLEGAIKSYMKILQRRPVAAGVKYNIALALIQQDRIEDAARMLEYALADCANYRPAAAALIGCYEKLGEDEKLAELKRRWHIQELSPPEAEAS
jgi:hypothetical protein